MADRLWHTFKVAGATFVDSYPDNLYKLAEIQQARIKDELGPDEKRYITLEMERTPDNPHDENAIVLSAMGVGILGHVPRDVASQIAPRIDAGEEWRAYLLTILVDPEHKDRPGAHVYMYEAHHGAKVDPRNQNQSPPQPHEMKWADDQVDYQ